MTEQTQEPEEAFTALQTMFRSMAEREEREIAERKVAERTGFFGAIPEHAKTLYVHLSHKIREGHPFVRELQTSYGIDNVLVTVAPERSGQSFYDDSRDKAAEMGKRKQVIEPFENFSVTKSIDALIYLCNYLCDGYQSPIFPEDVVTKWHIWRPIKLAEQLQKPLIVGYQNGFCFGVKCYEREYLTGATEEKIKCPTKVVRI
ncbi:MAG: hypothetical protein AABX34_07205 [Nanoarchaeota archaeon]